MMLGGECDRIGKLEPRVLVWREGVTGYFQMSHDSLAKLLESLFSALWRWPDLLSSSSYWTLSACCHLVSFASPSVSFLRQTTRRSITNFSNIQSISSESGITWINFGCCFVGFFAVQCRGTGFQAWAPLSISRTVASVLLVFNNSHLVAWTAFYIQNYDLKTRMWLLSTLLIWPCTWW